MGAAVRTLVGLALAAAVACDADDDAGLGAVPGDAGRDAAVTPTDAGTHDAGRPMTPEANVGAACVLDSECHGPATPRCRDRIDPGATVEGVTLWVMDLVGVSGEDGGAAIPIPDLEVEVQGGYCSGACVNDGDCGGGAVCFGLAPVLEAFGLVPDGGMPGGFFSESGVCLQPCDRDNDCRASDGHVCRDGLAGAPPLVEIPGIPTVVAPFTVCLPPLE